MDVPHLLAAMTTLLALLGGLTRVWRFDRMRTVLDHRPGDLMPMFAAFAKHHGVQAIVCRPRSGNRKGVVEKNNHTAAQRWWRNLADELTLELAELIRASGPWGQAFPEPLFDNLFECAGWKPMGEGHWRLSLRDPRDGSLHDAVMFNVGRATPPPRLRAVYELVVNDWQGRESPRLLLRHVEPA